jgi:hypothetical protein
MASAAVLLVAAEAATPGFLVRGPGLHTTRLAFVKSPVQPAGAKDTTGFAHDFGKVQIDFLQKWIYLWIGQVSLAPAFSDSVFQHLRSEIKNPRRANPCEGSNYQSGCFRKFEGAGPLSIANRVKTVLRKTRFFS